MDPTIWIFVQVRDVFSVWIITWAAHHFLPTGASKCSLCTYVTPHAKIINNRERLIKGHNCSPSCPG